MAENTPKYLDESLSFEERAADMVAQMTIDECASQLLFEAGKVERLGVKFYNWWNEALHGVARCGLATVFPQAVGLAATFDPKQVRKVADVIATEGRAKYNMFQKYQDYGIYKGITYWSPNVNIFRDPRWGRGQETYGEDPWLTGVLGEAFVKGLQGDDPRYLKTAACAKHFAVHSGPEKVRHEFDAVASKQDMAETYLPAFKRLCQAGVAGFMGAYNRTNGEPCCGSKTLMKDLLRGEWGFDGYYTSDCGALMDFHQYHKITKTATGSVAMALENGCDLNCGSLYGHLLASLQEGLITEEQIRESATRLMTIRMKLGMFDQKTPFDSIPYDVVDCPAHRELNHDTAVKSMVLLKNNGILPLNPEKLKNVAVVGPNANSITALHGNYHGMGNQYYTVLQGVQKEAEGKFRVNYSEGSHLYKNKLEDLGYTGDGLSEARTLFDLADAVILVVGLDETIEGEEMANSQDFTGDKKTLYLPQTQRDLIKAACESKAPVILVNMSGSSIDFGCGNEGAAAILQAWYPGAEGGRAVSDLIFGRQNPSGKLPMTFYKETNTLPAFEDYSMEGRTYKFFNEDPLFPFGFGLSYTKFAYTDLVLGNPDEAGNAIASLTVSNTGSVSGDAVAELYLRFEESGWRVPRHKLCGTGRVALAPGQSAKIEIHLEAEQFCQVDTEGKLVRVPGNATLFAGGCQPDEYSTKLSGETPASLRFTIE